MVRTFLHANNAPMSRFPGRHALHVESLSIVSDL